MNVESKRRREKKNAYSCTSGNKYLSSSSSIESPFFRLDFFFVAHWCVIESLFIARRYASGKDIIEPVHISMYVYVHMFCSCFHHSNIFVEFFHFVIRSNFFFFFLLTKFLDRLSCHFYVYIWLDESS